jgi:hypothetical protein
MKPTLLIFAAALALAACGTTEDVEYAYPDASRGKVNFYEKEEGMFGTDGLSLFGGDADQPGQGGSGIAVNSFLWRASLDTVSFLPLVSADPFGGVIITDWQVVPETPDERVKMQIYILDRQLRSDGLRVAVFRERRVDGQWVADTVSPRTIRTIEDSILARARELRVNTPT